MQACRKKSKQLCLCLAALGAVGCSSGATLPLGLTLTGSGAVATQPSPCEIDVAFVDTAVGQTSTATLEIADPGTSPLSLSASDATLDPAFAVAVGALNAPVSPGGSAGVGLSFSPTAVAASASTFVISTSPTAGTCSLITVNLAGNGVLFTLAVDPNTIDLGSAVLDTSVTQTVSLTNPSVGTVSGLTATIGGSRPMDFAVNGMPDWLDAGASAQVSVVFHPLIPIGTSSATVTFAGPQGESAKLNVSGEPLAAPLTLTPNPLDFGFVLPNDSATVCTVAANVTTGPLTVTGLRSFMTSGGAFATSSTDDSTPPKPAPVPVTIAPGGSAKLCFTLTPQQISNAQYQGQVTVVTDQPSVTYPQLQLTGWGGGPQLSCNAPATLSFGQTVDGTTTTLSILCTNIGTSGQLPNLSLKPSASPSMFTASFDATVSPYPLGGLGPDQGAQIDVSYTPTGSGPDQGTLTIGSNGGQGNGLQIPLTGDALNLAPCRFAIVPPAVDFGNVLPDGGPPQRSFAVQNLGSDSCLVKDLAIQDDATKSFQIVSTSIQPDAQSGWITIPAASGLDGGLQVVLSYRPRDAGPAAASADFWISTPGQENQTVPLRGSSGIPCLIFVPATLDFGKVGTRDGGALCPSASRSITVFDQCTTEANLESINLESTSGDETAQFSAPSGPALPTTFDGSPVSYSLTFQPTALGSHSAQLVFAVDGGAETLASVAGDAIAAATQTDSFVAEQPKADFLFVRDVGDDIYSEPIVAADIADFLDAGAGVDYRLAVTTDDDNPKYADADYGRLLPCLTCFAKGPEPIIVSPSSTPDGGVTPDPVAVFVDLLGAGGAGSRDTGTNADKHMMASLFDALTRDPNPAVDFFRPGAYFAVINESGDNDPDESYVIQSEAWYQTFFTSWFPDPATFSWNYINPSFDVTGTGLSNPVDLAVQIEALVNATSGLAMNSQDPAWTTAFLALWPAAASANLRYHLSTLPLGGAAGVNVTVNGVPDFAPDWTYDSIANAVAFMPSSAPPNGATIEISYPIGCP